MAFSTEEMLARLKVFEEAKKAGRVVNHSGYAVIYPEAEAEKPSVLLKKDT